MHSNYLSKIKLTHFSDKFIASNTAGQVITMLDLYNNHVNGISGSLQSIIYGQNFQNLAPVCICFSLFLFAVQTKKKGIKNII